MQKWWHSGEHQNRLERYVWNGFGLVLLVPVLLFSFLLGLVLLRGLRSADWQYVFSLNEGLLSMTLVSTGMTLLALCIAFPFALASAVYLSEYSLPGIRRGFLVFIIDMLASVPSVLYGMFGLLVFGRVLGLGQSILSGSCTLALMILPVLIRSSERALREIDDNLREALRALGGSDFQVLFWVVLPAAVPAVLAAVLRSAARMFGSAAPVLLTVGISLPSGLPDIMQSGRSLPAHLYYSALSALSGFDFARVYTAAAVLVIIVFVLHLCAFAVQRWRRASW
jgi:phosphate transport system permease protein